MQFGDFRDQCDEVKGQTDMADYVSLRDQQTMSLSLPDISMQGSPVITTLISGHPGSAVSAS